MVKIDYVADPFMIPEYNKIQGDAIGSVKN
jgi:hypothetical protein